MSAQFISAARDWLAHHCDMTAGQADALAGLAPLLLEVRPRTRPLIAGLGGPPGTGKSTLAQMLAAASKAVGESCAVLSLDDYYLKKSRRKQLAAEVHPLFAVRGVPGTHDIGLLNRHIDRIVEGGFEGLELPRFDKARDDRHPAWTTYRGDAPPRILIIEGWVVGAPAMDPGTLGRPVNALERKQDPDGSWRSAVNRHLAGYHASLGARLSTRWYLRAPDWESIVAWRWQQEKALRQQGICGLANESDTRSFLATYQRLCRHMQNSCHEWADRVIQFDRAHRPSI